MGAGLSSFTKHFDSGSKTASADGNKGDRGEIQEIGEGSGICCLEIGLQRSLDPEAGRNVGCIRIVENKTVTGGIPGHPQTEGRCRVRGLCFETACGGVLGGVAGNTGVELAGGVHLNTGTVDRRNAGVVYGIAADSGRAGAIDIDSPSAACDTSADIGHCVVTDDDIAATEQHPNAAIQNITHGVAGEGKIDAGRGGLDIDGVVVTRQIRDGVVDDSAGSARCTLKINRRPGKIAKGVVVDIEAGDPGEHPRSGHP